MDRRMVSLLYFKGQKCFRQLKQDSPNGKKSPEHHNFVSNIEKLLKGVGTQRESQVLGLNTLHYVVITFFFMLFLSLHNLSM